MPETQRYNWFHYLHFYHCLSYNNNRPNTSFCVKLYKTGSQTLSLDFLKERCSTQIDGSLLGSSTLFKPPPLLKYLLLMICSAFNIQYTVLVPSSQKIKLEFGKVRRRKHGQSNYATASARETSVHIRSLWYGKRWKERGWPLPLPIQDLGSSVMVLGVRL